MKSPFPKIICYFPDCQGCLKYVYKRGEFQPKFHSFMEGCLVGAARSLRYLATDQVAQVLRHETPRLEITKSLLTILYNVCLIKSVPLSIRLKEEFRKHTSIVVRLLKGANKALNKTTDLAGKKKILIKNPQLVKLLAEVCPPNQNKSVE